jgi:hypothetical protein
MRYPGLESRCSKPSSAPAEPSFTIITVQLSSPGRTEIARSVGHSQTSSSSGLIQLSACNGTATLAAASGLQRCAPATPVGLGRQTRELAWSGWRRAATSSHHDIVNAHDGLEPRSLLGSVQACCFFAGQSGVNRESRSMLRNASKQPSFGCAECREVGGEG